MSSRLAGNRLGWIALCFAAGSAPCVHAQEEGEAVRAAFGRAIAHLDGLEKALDELSRSGDAAAPALEKALRRMSDSLDAIRGLAPADRKLLARLRSARVGKISFNANTGDYREVCKLLPIVTAIPVKLSREAERQITKENLVLEVEIDEPVSVESFLNLMTDRSQSLTWCIRDGVVWITTHEAEAAAAAADAAMPRATTAKDNVVLERLRGTNVASSFQAAALGDWTAYYEMVSRATFEIDPAVAKLPDNRTTLTNFQRPAMSVDAALDAITRSLELDWKIENEVVRIVPRDESGGIAQRIRYHQDRIRALRAQLAAEQHEKK